MSEVTKKSLRYLCAIDENGGHATTTEIRNETGMTNSEVNYRHDKLEELGYVDIERDPEIVPDGMSYCKRAVLTDYAKHEIQKGLLVEAEQDAQGRPSIKTNAERIDEIEETVESVRSEFNNRILPACRDWHDTTLRVLIYLDQSDDIDVSISELLEIEIDDETASLVTERVK
jgi:DNA-binding MarR family transcriptional regulator